MEWGGLVGYLAWLFVVIEDSGAHDLLQILEPIVVMKFIYFEPHWYFS